MRRRFMNESKITFDYNDYMTIEALEDNVEISLTRVSEYGINGVGWTKYKNKIVVNSGDFVSIKHTLNKGETYGNISINGKCNLHGNCNSLIFGDYASSYNDLSEYNNCFQGLLKNNSGVQKVDSNFLPATTLSSYCYREMFMGCTSLTFVELPATTLASYCYEFMFCHCADLTTAPELPATILADRCYAEMFRACHKLNYIKMLAIDRSASYCLDAWVMGVASSGTFVKNKNATWDVTGVSSIPNGWTVINDGEDIGSDEITFYVEDLNEEYPTIQYKAKKGMTWEQFCNSKYNVNDWYIEDTTHNFVIHQYGDILCYMGSSVRSTDIILSNKAYTYNA